MKYIIYNKKFNKELNIIELSKINFVFRNKKQIFNFLRLSRLINKKYFNDFEIYNLTTNKKEYDIYHFLNLHIKKQYRLFTRGF